MKKLILLLLLYSGISNAQNWKCLQPAAKHYFTNSQGYLRGIRIDSVRASGSDSIFYPYHTPRGYYSRYHYADTLDSTAGSWLGKKVIMQPGGTFLFDNLWHDTVVIKTHANIGDTWIFYNDTTSLFYEATLISQDTMTVLGTPDSIKTILITAHNASGIVTSDPADSLTLTLSKNNGFVNIFDLYTFPYHAPDSSYHIGLDYYLDYVNSLNSLASISSLQRQKLNFALVTLVNRTNAKLTQWNVGDIYEYGSCRSYFEHYGDMCIPVEYYYMDTVTGMTTTAGSTMYNYSGWKATFADPSISPLSYTPPPYYYIVSGNSGSVTCDSVLIIDTSRMPEEYSVQTNTTNTGLYVYLPADTSYCASGPLYSLLGFGPEGYLVGAVYNTLFEHMLGPTTYKFPIGLVSRYRSGAGSDGALVESQLLIFYQRAGAGCGAVTTPSTSVPEILTGNETITVMPNPAQDIITVTGATTIRKVIITNTLGQTLSSYKYNTKTAQINVSFLPPGVYLLRINDEVVKKFVKE